MHPDHVFKALATHLHIATGGKVMPDGSIRGGRPGGHGYGVHDGFEVKCAGLIGPNPRYEEDSAAGLNPEKEMLIQHLIGTFTLTEDARKRGVQTFAVGNKAHDGEFVLDSAQAKIDPANPVCQVCGQPLIL